MDQIGQVIEYRASKKSKPVTGTVVGIRHSAKTIMNMKTFKEFPAAELLIEPNNGKRSFWTRPFKNA